MDIDIRVRGSIAGTRRPEEDSRVSLERGNQVKIGFFLKDILMVIGADDRIKQLAYRTLHDHMDMDSQAAEDAKSEVATTIRDKVLSARNNIQSQETILLEIHVECTIEIRNEEAGEPSGEHGCNRLVERLDNESCAICHNEFNSAGDISVTTCHHTFHRLCLFQWLYRGTRTCPICRANQAPIVGGQISF
ncbi:E3 ubiquitin-protein ligase [Nymphaea thermarum]|nr:E3 ubiquitin-protein ligase [Nymphaea thermarum]